MNCRIFVDFVLILIISRGLFGLTGRIRRLGGFGHGCIDRVGHKPNGYRPLFSFTFFSGLYCGMYVSAVEGLSILSN